MNNTRVHQFESAEQIEIPARLNALETDEALKAAIERYTHRECIVCGCTEERACLDANNQVCAWADRTQLTAAGLQPEDDLCTHCWRMVMVRKSIEGRLA